MWKRFRQLYLHLKTLISIRLGINILVGLFHSCPVTFSVFWRGHLVRKMLWMFHNRKTRTNDWSTVTFLVFVRFEYGWQVYLLVKGPQWPSGLFNSLLLRSLVSSLLFDIREPDDDIHRWSCLQLSYTSFWNCSWEFPYSKEITSLGQNITCVQTVKKPAKSRTVIQNIFIIPLSIFYTQKLWILFVQKPPYSRNTFSHLFHHTRKKNVKKIGSQGRTITEP